MNASHPRRHLGTALALAISVVMGGLTFCKPSWHPLGLHWRFDPHELWSVLGAHPLAFAMVFLLEGVQLPLRAVLWKFVLPRGVTTQPARYHALALGGLAQNILPARAGELVRGLALARSVPSLGRTRSLTTVATSKLPELAALLTFAALAPLTVDLGTPALAWFRRGAYIGAGLLVVLIGVVLLVGRARGRVERIEAALRHLPGKLGTRLAFAVEELAHGAAACGSARRALAAYGMALATIAAAVGAFMFGLWAVGAPHSVGAATVVLCAVSLGMSVPSSPSGVGVFHFVCLLSLGAMGVDPARAAAFALATHLMGTSVNIGLGLHALVKGHDSLRGLAGGDEARPPSEPVAAAV